MWGKIFAFLAKHGNQEARGNGRADDAGDVRAHGVHEQEVRRVRLLALDLGHARRHGHRRHARRADQRVDLAAGELIHKLADKQSANGGERKGNQTQCHDRQSPDRQEAGSHGSGADADAKEQGDDVHQRVLGGVAQALGDAGFTQQVAEHQAADERGRGGDEQNDEGRNHDGEDYLLRLGNLARLLHLHLALFLGGKRAHDGRLDERDERHVGIRGNGDRP